MTPHPDVEPAPGSTPTYADAVAELESILVELEDETVDVDRLAEQVGRAAELIRICRRRIDQAQVEIEQIVAELGDDPDRV